MSERTPQNGQVEPPDPMHRTVVFTFRWPDGVAHGPSAVCPIQEPHLIAECAAMAVDA